METPTTKYYCYIVFSGTKTYAGYTVSPLRRLRQHNQEIKGGAASTSGRQDWQFLTVMTCEDWGKGAIPRSRPMQVEYLHKHPTGTKKRPPMYSGPQGRILALKEICVRLREDEKVRVYIHPDWLSMAQRVCADMTRVTWVTALTEIL